VQFISIRPLIMCLDLVLEQIVLDLDNIMVNESPALPQVIELEDSVKDLDGEDREGEVSFLGQFPRKDPTIQGFMDFYSAAHLQPSPQARIRDSSRIQQHEKIELMDLEDDD